VVSNSREEYCLGISHKEMLLSAVGLEISHTHTHTHKLAQQRYKTWQNTFVCPETHNKPHTLTNTVVEN
jgi:hypothetical protein